MYHHQVTRLARKLNSISLNQISLCFSIRTLNTQTDPKPIENNDRTARDEVARIASDKLVSLECPSTAKGGVCDVYLVGVRHFCSDSCNLVQIAINCLKPQVVFLELCRYRAGFINTPEVIGANEFHVAYKEAIKYGGSVVLGDRSYHITRQRLRDIVTQSERVSGLGSVPKDVVVSYDDAGFVDFDHIYEKNPAFYEEVLIHERDKYMSSELLKVAREHNSVVAVVGEAHLPGMRTNLEQSIQQSQVAQSG